METKLYPCQEVLLEKMKQGTEIKIFMSGRQTGKSLFSSSAMKRLLDDLKNRPVEELILNEARVHGARYHTVEPVGGNWLEMELWCKATFGEPGDMWNADDWCWPEDSRWLMNNRRFLFRNEKDRTMFIMRWSSR